MLVLRELIQTNFAPAIGMFFTIFFLIGDKNLSRKHKFFFWSAVAACITELIATNIELSLAAPNTTFIRWHIFWSAIGYTVRPAILYIILGLTVDRDLRDKSYRRVGYVLIFNTFLAFSAFFSGIAYSFNEENRWGRGPLGMWFYYILAFYLAIIVTGLIGKKQKYIGIKMSLGIACVGIVIIAMICEMENMGVGLSRTAMVFSLLGYLMYFQSTEYQKEHIAKVCVAEHDSLTGALNRYAFENQTQELTKSEEALEFMILDIDKFKAVNDTYGRALKKW